MKYLLTSFFSFLVLNSFAQDSLAKPVEVAHNNSSAWNIVWVLVALAAGIIAYFLIKKNPRKDAE